MSEKTCFIISPIGEEGSETRKIADEKFDLVFEPVLKELGYNAVRADKESTPNLISRGIITRIINSELVIADVTDYNPNVFYELAVRNAVKKPVIVIRKPGQKLAFDIYDKRAVTLDMSINREWVKAKEQLKEYIKNTEINPNEAAQSMLSEFSFEIDLNAAKNAQDSITIQLKDIRDELRRIRQRQNDMVHYYRSSTTGGVSEELPSIGLSMSSLRYSEGDEIEATVDIRRRLEHNDFTLSLVDPTLTTRSSVKITLMGVGAFNLPLGRVDKSWLKGPWVCSITYGNTTLNASFLIE